MIVTGPLAELNNNKNPSPGEYEIPSTKSKISYSLRAKFPYESKEPMKIPGPGKCKNLLIFRWGCPIIQKRREIFSF